MNYNIVIGSQVKVVVENMPDPFSFLWFEPIPTYRTVPKSEVFNGYCGPGMAILDCLALMDIKGIEMKPE